jgi:hypothetical protein
MSLLFECRNQKFATVLQRSEMWSRHIRHTVTFADAKQCTVLRLDSFCVSAPQKLPGSAPRNVDLDEYPLSRERGDGVRSCTTAPGALSSAAFDLTLRRYLTYSRVGNRLVEAAYVYQLKSEVPCLNIQFNTPRR